MTEQDWDRKIQEYQETYPLIKRTDYKGREILKEAFWWETFHHLQKYLPKQYKELGEAGTLERTLDKRMVAFHETWDSLRESGLNVDEARSMAERQYIYLTPEPEMVNAPEEWEEDEEDDLNKLLKIRREAEKELSEIYREAEEEEWEGEKVEILF